MTTFERDLLLWGWCPFCFADLRGYVRPEKLETRDIVLAGHMQIDPSTRHELTCRYKDDVEALIKKIREAKAKP